MDQTRIIIDSNRAARQLLGDEAVGKELTTILESEEIIQEIENSLNGKPGTRREVYFPQPIARTYDFIAWQLPNLTAPAPAWAMVALHDITEVKMADRMHADFVANVSHEMRSPLTSLLGFVPLKQ